MAGLGLSLVQIHIYLDPLKKALQVLWAVGVLGSLYLMATQVSTGMIQALGVNMFSAGRVKGKASAPYSCPGCNQASMASLSSVQDRMHNVAHLLLQCRPPPVALTCALCLVASLKLYHIACLPAVHRTAQQRRTSFRTQWPSGW